MLIWSIVRWPQVIHDARVSSQMRKGMKWEAHVECGVGGKEREAQGLANGLVCRCDIVPRKERLVITSIHSVCIAAAQIHIGIDVYHDGPDDHRLLLFLFACHFERLEELSGNRLYLVPKSDAFLVNNSKMGQRQTLTLNGRSLHVMQSQKQLSSLRSTSDYNQHANAKFRTQKYRQQPEL